MPISSEEGVKDLLQELCLRWEAKRALDTTSAYLQTRKRIVNRTGCIMQAQFLKTCFLECSGKTESPANPQRKPEFLAVVWVTGSTVTVARCSLRMSVLVVMIMTVVAAAEFYHQPTSQIMSRKPCLLWCLLFRRPSNCRVEQPPSYQVPLRRPRLRCTMPLQPNHG